MPTINANTTEFYDLTNVILSLSADRETTDTMYEACSNSDFCFGTNWFSLVRAVDLAWEWRNWEELKAVADQLEKEYGESLINLEA